MKLKSKHIIIMGIVQVVGPFLGILTTFYDPTGGHPGLAVMMGLVVFPLNLLLAVVQIIIALMLLMKPSFRSQMEPMHCWGYVATGWFLTILFWAWQWPPLFISI